MQFSRPLNLRTIVCLSNILLSLSKTKQILFFVAIRRVGVILLPRTLETFSVPELLINSALLCRLPLGRNGHPGKALIVFDPRTRTNFPTAKLSLLRIFFAVDATVGRMTIFSFLEWCRLFYPYIVGKGAQTLIANSCYCCSLKAGPSKSYTEDEIATVSGLWKR